MSTPDTRAEQSTEQFLTFLLAGQEYGVDILRVQEIKGWDLVTRLPNTPSFIKGVINLRGSIVPIIDLRERFHLEPIPYGPTTVVVLLRVESGGKSRVMGLVVDAVSDVCSVGSDGLKPPPDLGGIVDVAFVKALATFDQKMVVILEIDRLLASGELTATDVAATAAA